MSTNINVVVELTSEFLFSFLCLESGKIKRKIIWYGKEIQLLVGYFLKFLCSRTKKQMFCFLNIFYLKYI